MKQHAWTQRLSYSVKSEKNKYCMMFYILNLKTMIQMTFYKDRNRLTDIENKFMVIKGEGGEG